MQNGIAEGLLKEIRKIWTIKETGVLEPGRIGELTYTGLTIERGEDLKLVIHQKRYLEDVLVRWQMERCNPSKTTGEIDGFNLQKKRENGRGEEVRERDALKDVA
eukprot:659748-Amphidinium_carterae.1